MRGKVSQKNLGFWYTVCKGKKLRKSKEKLKYRESKKMHKKHMFLRVFSKITILVCVFCTLSAWADTTTCDINFTPVTGNSWQNGTPTPTNPVEIESIGTKVGNKYQIPVVAQGKNLIDVTQFGKSKTINGITWTLNADGTVTANGTATANSAWYFINEDMLKLPHKGTYTISFKILGGTTDILVGGIKYDTGWKDIYDFVLTSQEVSYIISGWVRIDSGKTVNNLIIGIQIEEGSVATSYAPYGHSTTPIYLNAPLRKIGNYADVLDYKNGTITRNVGVKVFDGTENWDVVNLAGVPTFFGISKVDLATNSTILPATSLNVKCSHLPATSASNTHNAVYVGSNYVNLTHIGDVADDLTEWKAWLASEYAAGTPVTVYYPLATPVVEQIENWSCPVPITDIQIATTKMVDDEFAQAEANLAATVQTIESVVSRTIAQTGQIATLHETKQTRPDESCPANMKCLLVQDEDGTPHWYPIIEP
ncbi:MAG: hypothetical protein MJ164_02180 [Alphaproteobacteria bacterium]|nr:hypothetical protein [Alphaproteobacteria bacterium]